MNPLHWERRHQVALMIASVIGAALGIVLGYVVYGAASGTEGGVGFSYWFGHSLRYGGHWWAAFGAAVSAGFIYVHRLIST